MEATKYVHYYRQRTMISINVLQMHECTMFLPLCSHELSCRCCSLEESHQPLKTHASHSDTRTSMLHCTPVGYILVVLLTLSPSVLILLFLALRGQMRGKMREDRHGRCRLVHADCENAQRTHTGPSEEHHI